MDITNQNSWLHNVHLAKLKDLNISASKILFKFLES